MTTILLLYMATENVNESSKKGRGQGAKFAILSDPCPWEFCNCPRDVPDLSPSLELDSFPHPSTATAILCCPVRAGYVFGYAKIHTHFIVHIGTKVPIITCKELATYEWQVVHRFSEFLNQRV